MTPSERELWKTLDYAVFETNEPAGLEQGMARVKAQYARERSSLGRFLTSLREFDSLSIEAMATRAGVTSDTWRDWEMDYVTPTIEELQKAAQHLRWGTRKWGIASGLRENSPRFRLLRLASFQPKVLAARGALDRGGLAWSSVDESARTRITAWGECHGYSFPGELAEFLQGLPSEAARESWVDEILRG